MQPMTPTELRVAIAQLGITQRDLAKMLHLGERTIHNYLGGSSIPAPTAILIRIMVARRNWGDLLTIGYGGTQ
jgi:plasmid maintenance system antidote protein VapI